MDGYHRYEALKELGYENVEIKNFGKISREQAIKITLSIEETGVELDPILKAGLLKEMRDMQYDMEGLPYTVEEIETQIQLLDFDMQKFEESEGPDERKLKEVECPSCHETFTI